MELQMAKGMRDFPPEEMIVREKIINQYREVFESYGYPPLETPLLERMDVLTAKFAAGEGSDAMKEIFSLKDQGERELGLRFDLTVPFARFVGMNPNLKMPFKRYQIGRVFRDGPIKLGRYREFWQCDVDISGCKEMMADAECVMIAFDVFKKLGLDVTLQINNREVLFAIMDKFGIPEEKQGKVIVAVDKLDKIGVKGVVEELKPVVNPETTEKLIELLTSEGTNEELLKKVQGIVGETEGIKQLNEIFSLVKNKDLKFNPALARGLSYYTGTVFEGYLKNKEISSSVCGGGRYDKLIGNYLQSEKEYPTVGISFGIEPVMEYLKMKRGMGEKTTAQIFLIPIKTAEKCLEIAGKLREEGLKVSMDLTGKGISKNLDYANALGIPFVVIVGEKELKAGVVKLKNMKTGEEKEVEVGKVKEIVKSEFN